jgi:peroxiredoxin
LIFETQTETDMNRRVFATTLAAAAAISLLAVPVQAEPKVGAPAPAFTAVDSNGKTVNLSDYKGKTVVLEWTNDGCPYVRKHYGAGNMQALQKKWTEEGIVWLSVISSPPGEQGFADAKRANALTLDRKASPTAVLLDQKQNVAKAYGALVTPHMYIIKPDGVLAYAGAIDDKPTARTADLKGAKNFVDEALTELKAGKPVSTTNSRAYGCVVKYNS